MGWGGLGWAGVGGKVVESVGGVRGGGYLSKTQDTGERNKHIRLKFL